MNSNLFIRMYKSGKLISEYAGHNIWVDYGSKYLADLVSLSSYGPDVTIEDRRIKYIGFGIGGSKQTLLSIANSSPIVDSYPAGYDPPGIHVLDDNMERDGIGSWITGPNSIVTKSIVNPQSGKQCLDIILDGYAYGCYAYQDILTVGKNYRLTGYGRSNGESLPFIQIYDGAPVWVGTYETTEWQPFDVTFTATDVRILFAIWGTGGGYDDILLLASSSGNEYKREFPINPMITSLERPVRITPGVGGGLLPYITAAADDIWLAKAPAPGFITTFPAPGEVTFRTTIDASKVDPMENGILYSPFLEMPLSEVGLFLSGADINSPYNVDPEQLVAYHSFDTQLFTLGTILELTWNVRF